LSIGGEQRLLFLHKARRGRAYVSDQRDGLLYIKRVTYDQLVARPPGGNIKDDIYNSRLSILTCTGKKAHPRLYHYPSLRGQAIHGLFEARESAVEAVEVAERTVESSLIVGTEHGVSHAAAALMAPELAGHLGHAVGMGLHGVIATAVATFITLKVRDREEEFR
jgi:hypothetical protein